MTFVIKSYHWINMEDPKLIEEKIVATYDDMRIADRAIRALRKEALGSYNKDHDDWYTYGAYRCKN